MNGVDWRKKAISGIDLIYWINEANAAWVKSTEWKGGPLPKAGWNETKWNDNGMKWNESNQRSWVKGQQTIQEINT